MLTVYRLKITLAAFIFLLFALLVNMYNFHPTGMATATEVTSQVFVQLYIAIEASENLTTEGIRFNISALPAIDANSTGSYGDGEYENRTMQNITVSPDTSVSVDICIKANANLTSGSNVITIDNYKWANSTANNLTDPDFGFRRSFNTTFYPATKNLAAGNALHFRFWLNVSGGQPAGIYNNTINFKAVQTEIGGCA